MNTPRTIAESFVLNSVHANQISPDTVVVSAEFARQLETEAQELRAALEWVAEIADKNYDTDDKLRANGARTLARISDHARAALAKVPK